jgi:hypothetical protein
VPGIGRFIVSLPVRPEVVEVRPRLHLRAGLPRAHIRDGGETHGQFVVEIDHIDCKRLFDVLAFGELDGILHVPETQRLQLPLVERNAPRRLRMALQQPECGFGPGIRSQSD